MRYVKPQQLARWTALSLAGAIVFVCIAACGAPSPTPPPTQVLPTQPASTVTSRPTAPMPPQPTPSPAPPSPSPQPGKSLTTFTTDNFAGSGTCQICHTNLKDASGQDVSIDTAWRSAMMANAAKDPYWQAQVASEVLRHPALSEVIQERCATCHMPMARQQAAVSQSTVMVLPEDDGFLKDTNALHSAALDGVSCTLCHQIQNQRLGEPDSFSGGYLIDTALLAPNRPAYGPFDNQQGRIMQNSVGFVPLYGEQTLQAALCATCHTLYTPYVDAQGNVQGTFPEQVAFLEWGHSQYGNGSGEVKPCQGCHMPAAAGNVPISSVPSGLQGRSPFAQHIFVGGNAFMVRLHAAYVDELGMTASTEQFESKLAQVQTQLHTRTAILSILNAVLDGDTLSVTVQIENLAGHKFPTGFPSRRAWIHLKVTDADGRVAFESGAANPDGSVTGDDADADVTTYERHYDTIDSAEQVQMYQSVMHNTDGEITYTLLRGAGYAKDNRLLPLGFDKASAGKDFAVVGEAAGDEDFVGGSDRVAYQVSVRGFAKPFTVSVELLYQSVSYRFGEDLRGEQEPLVESFMRMYDATDKSPELFDSVEAVVQ